MPRRDDGSCRKTLTPMSIEQQQRRRRRQRRNHGAWLSTCSPSFKCRILLVLFIVSYTQVIPSSALTGSALWPRRTATTATRFTRVTSRRMVLTTPESIIEQASTQNLLDLLIDESVRTSARGPIMMQFDPSSGWIWKRWRGTVFSETWDSCIKSMLYAVIILMIFKRFPSLKDHFSGFNVLWGQLLSVTTFTLTFFVNQSYALWRKCMGLSRRLQGRLHDIGMTLAIHASRKPPSSPNEPSTYTTASRQTLELVSRYVRLFNVLTYASFTRSHRPILTPRGMRRLVERGLMTAQEREVLVAAEVPATQRHNAVLLWITRVFVEGWQAGHFIGATGFENQVLEKIHVCRAQYGAIGDELAGRMPLAYAHIVQVLVDAVLWFYPLMAIVSNMSDGLVVLGTGLLTISYQGLFDLAKQFLDPYDNESYGKGEDPLVVDTLIAETNAGSVRWMNSLNEFPVSSQRIKDGELSDYLLPVRGYSVEELAELEEERKKREREQQERREREEEERRIAEEKAKRLREASEAMIPALLPKTPSYRVPGTVVFGTTINGSHRGTVNGSTREFSFPNAPDSFSLSSSENISQVVNNMNAMAGGFPSSLLPRGTSAGGEDDEIVIQKRRRKKEKEKKLALQKVADDDDDEENDGEIVGEIEEFVDDGDFQVIEDWGLDEKYELESETPSTFDGLPWLDEVDPDRQEVRLSQVLADEEWEEEREAAREKEQAIQTFEEYTRRVEEIKTASSNKLAETEEIVTALPNAEFPSASSRGNIDEDTYNQTKLDGTSQLWGCKPGELSDLPSYTEPKVTGETEFRGIAQLFGTPEVSSSRTDDELLDPYSIEDTPSFGGIGALWGGFDDDSDGVDTSSSATRPVRENAKSYRDVQAQLEETDIQRGTFKVSDSSEVRLSQILADEVWDEEENVDEIEEVVSVEEYAQQIADIIEMEKEEQLETEAILNAPSFAEYVGTAEEDGGSAKALKAKNSTLDEDDLSVFEMDVEQETVTEVTDSELPSDDAAKFAQPESTEPRQEDDETNDIQGSTEVVDLVPPDNSESDEDSVAGTNDSQTDGESIQKEDGPDESDDPEDGIIT